MKRSKISFIASKACIASTISAIAPSVSNVLILEKADGLKGYMHWKQPNSYNAPHMSVAGVFISCRIYQIPAWKVVGSIYQDIINFKKMSLAVSSVNLSEYALDFNI